MPPELPPATTIMRNLGLEPDPWQIEVLDAGHHQILLNCCRQAGKSTVVAVLGLVQALFKPMSRVLIVSRSHRQSRELFKQIVLFHKILGGRLKERLTANELEFKHLSRIVCVPCNEETIRGFSKVDLLIVDEAARVPDDLYRAVRPMLAVSKGRIVCLSTPYGARGFFHNAWVSGGDDWTRFEIPASKIPRIDATFLARERRALGESWFRQEYCCSFEALEGLVYPDFARCVVDSLPPHLHHADASFFIRPSPLAPHTRLVGGIDFGFRNPFAALWGILDAEDVLWITGEHYARQKPLSRHIRKMPRSVEWYADPAGANERAELRAAGFTVMQGANALRPGIAAVSARLEDGTLRILKGRCPNLLAEAALYKYPDNPAERRAENPVDEHNHALAALRYLIAKIDKRRLARSNGQPPELASSLNPDDAARETKWLDMENDHSMWISLWPT